MTEETNSNPQSAPAPRRWRPLSAIDRRVLGVLAEKAKTTPDAYPMTINGIVAGANQKSNRSPLMNLEPEDVEESLDRLREFGAVSMVEGHGRVTKYRHYLYEWLEVEKVELSVMIELLLRGAQTEGELRGRASRMDPIADLTALRTLLAALNAKGLVVSLTPEGRGHVVTHALYSPREMENLKAQFANQSFVAPEEDVEPGTSPRPAVRGEPSSSPRAAFASSAAAADFASSHQDIEELRAQVRDLRREMEQLALGQQQLEEQVRTLRDALGG